MDTCTRAACPLHLNPIDCYRPRGLKSAAQKGEGQLMADEAAAKRGQQEQEATDNQVGAKRI